MWEKIKDNALSTIVTVLITGVVSIMGSSLANKNKTLEEFGELKNQITKNFDSLNARLDTELKLIDLKNKMQDEKIADKRWKLRLFCEQTGRQSKWWHGFPGTSAGYIRGLPVL